MDPGASIWIPIGVIFAAALIIGLLQRHSRDPCLKRFDDDYVLVQLKGGKWIWGQLKVLAKSLIVSYEQAQPAAEGHQKLSYALYEQNVNELLQLLRPIPRPGSPAYGRWKRNLDRMCHPSPLLRARRALRNLFNMLRDAFSQSIAVLVGTYKQRTRFGKVTGADAQATQVGQKLLTVVPNSYEQILERYLYHDVISERMLDANQSVEYLGVIEEYSDKFLLMRDVNLSGAPAEALHPDQEKHRFDAIFPRVTTIVRHLVQRNPEARFQSEPALSDHAFIARPPPELAAKR